MDSYRLMHESGNLGCRVPIPAGITEDVLEGAELYEVLDGMATFEGYCGDKTALIHGLAGEGFETDDLVLATNRKVIAFAHGNGYEQFRAEYLTDPLKTVQAFDGISESV